jgi:hypothetical protein
MKRSHSDWRFARAALGALTLTALATSIATAADPVSGDRIQFKKTVLDKDFRSEGVAVGDFNKDGKLDIAAGRVWFAAPDWKMHVIDGDGKAFDPHGYSGSFCNFADDVNGDGWTDVILVDFPGTPTYWFENPKNEGAWKKHTAAAVSNNESPQYVDANGDGKRDLLMAVAPAAAVDGPDRQMAIVSRGADPTKPWLAQLISSKGAPGTQRYSHGLGLGDVNADGRNDVLVSEGWWEAPQKGATGEWKFHAAPFGKACSHMYVYDFDGDGDMDVLSSSAHEVGIWWHEQQKDAAGKSTWKTHEIDHSFSQTHSLMLADINSDGLPDFVTGKRWWAHGPTGDVNPDAPAVMFWFELKRENGKPVWTPHEFDHDSGVGTQFEVIDFNGDGLLDVVTSNKKGTRFFLQERATK